MAYLALDLSKRSTGYALWEPGMAKPACGTWELGCELTSHGLVFARLHQRMSEIHSLTPIDVVAYEKPLDPQTMSRMTSPTVPFLLIGLAAHVESWCEATGVRSCSAHYPATWRRHFIGSMPRGTKSMALKDFVIARCRSLGITPHKHDAADAVGVLDFTLFLAGITPPWHLANPLQPELVATAHG